MRAIVADEYDYIIPQSSVAFTLNALGDPDNIDVTVLAGTKVTAYRSDIEQLGFMPSGNFRQWNLAGYPTHFTDADGCQRYCYVALERNGVNALIVYPSTLLDIFGRAVIPSAHGTYPFISNDGAILGLDDATLPDQLNQRLNGDYFFLFLGTLTSSRNGEQKVDRHWSATNQPIFGLLDTDAYRQQQAQSADLIELVPSPSTVQFKQQQEGVSPVATVTVRARRRGVIGTPEGEPVPDGYRVAGSTEAPVTTMPEESTTSFILHPSDKYLYLTLFRESDGAIKDSKSVAVINDGAQGDVIVPEINDETGVITWSKQNPGTAGQLPKPVGLVPQMQEESDGVILEVGGKRTKVFNGRDGSDGISPENVGQWSDGMFVPYLNLVSLNGVTYQCINPEGSNKRPYIIDKSLEFSLYDVDDYELVDADGYVLIVGEDGEDEYVIVAESALDMRLSQTVARVSGLINPTDNKIELDNDFVLISTAYVYSGSLPMPFSIRSINAQDGCIIAIEGNDIKITVRKGTKLSVSDPLISCILVCDINGLEKRRQCDVKIVQDLVYNTIHNELGNYLPKDDPRVPKAQTDEEGNITWTIGGQEIAKKEPVMYVSKDTIIVKSMDFDADDGSFTAYTGETAIIDVFVDYKETTLLTDISIEAGVLPVTDVEVEGQSLLVTIPKDTYLSVDDTLFIVSARFTLSGEFKQREMKMPIKVDVDASWKDLQHLIQTDINWRPRSAQPMSLSVEEDADDPASIIASLEQRIAQLEAKTASIK